MSTVEAIQADLENVGIILFPSLIGGLPPEKITDEELIAGEYRVFEKPNPNGPVYQYKRDASSKEWNKC